MTRAEALTLAVGKFREAGIADPSLDARRLLAGIEDIDATGIAIDPKARLQRYDRYLSAIERRVANEPVSKILGYKDFWAHRFETTPAVLDPRPDTEILVESVLEAVEPSKSYRILDAGTGSGCILLTLLHELNLSTGLGIDASSGALEIARRNADALKIGERVTFLLSDWFEKVDGTFDLVVCNPPYISLSESADLAPEVMDWDPHLALFGGMDGLQAYRTLADGLASVLHPEGTAFFEIGRGQCDAVSNLFRSAGFSRISPRKDLGGIDRCLRIAR